MLQDLFFVVRVEMLNCTDLATVQGGYMRPVCLFGSVMSMGLSKVVDK